MKTIKYFLMLLMLNSPALAHEDRPTMVVVTLGNSGSMQVQIMDDLESRISGIGSDHSESTDSDKTEAYDRLRKSPPDSLRLSFKSTIDSYINDLQLMYDRNRVELVPGNISIPEVGNSSLPRISTINFSGSIPLDATVLSWNAPKKFGNHVLRVFKSGDTQPFYAELLNAGDTTTFISLEEVLPGNAVERFFKYVSIGFEHIVPKGLDHILFIICLFLLSPKLKPLIWQVSSFTLAHTVTLGLGMYGLISLPSNIVEPLIAASIAFVAIENLFTDKLHRWRPILIFAFGLLHGLGFAGVLGEVGMPKDQFAVALIGFNFGVEVGQLAVLSACFVLVGMNHRKALRYRQLVSIPASVLIALVSVYWVVERTLV